MPPPFKIVLEVLTVRSSRTRNEGNQIGKKDIMTTYIEKSNGIYKIATRTSK